jgi:hypothetical protein
MSGKTYLFALSVLLIANSAVCSLQFSDGLFQNVVYLGNCPTILQDQFTLENVKAKAILTRLKDYKEDLMFRGMVEKFGISPGPPGMFNYMLKSCHDTTLTIRCGHTAIEFTAPRMHQGAPVKRVTQIVPITGLEEDELPLAQRPYLLYPGHHKLIRISM